MLLISLKEFAKTGRFGPIGIGSSKSELFSLLGPEGIDNKMSTGSIVLYGWYEFFFQDDGILYAIQNDHLSHCGNHLEMIGYEDAHFKVDHWPMEVGRDLTYKEVKAKLKLENIPFKEESNRYSATYDLKMESGVYFDFNNELNSWDGEEWQSQTIENPDDYLLIGIRLFEY